jgi:hypothetical protein
LEEEQIHADTALVMSGGPGLAFMGSLSKEDSDTALTMNKRTWSDPGHGAADRLKP